MVLGFAKEKGVPGAAEALERNAAIERLKHHLDPKCDAGQGPAGSPRAALPLPMLMGKTKPTSPAVKFIAAVIGFAVLAWFLASALYPNFAALLSHLRH